jgi:hypothetical protein
MFISKSIATSGDKFRDEHSVYFDGTNDNRINCGSDSSLDVGTNSFSVSVWYKAIDSTGSKEFWPIVAKGHSLSSGDGWAVSHLNSGSNLQKIFFDTVTSAGGGERDTEITGTNSVSFNTWIHLCCTFDNANDLLSVYINGNLASTRDVGDIPDLTDNSDIFLIGNDANSRDFEGYISEVAYYNGKALSEADANTLFNDGNPYDHKQGNSNAYLAGWWRCGDGIESAKGSTVFDMSGNGNHGTIENGPVFSSDQI